MKTKEKEETNEESKESVKRTFKELKELDNVVVNLFKADPKLEKTKFGYAYMRFGKKNFFPLVDEYNQELNYLWVENALTDPITKAVLEDKSSHRGFKFGKEELMKVVKSEIELVKRWNEKVVKVEPFFSSYRPENLKQQDIETLTGLILE